MSNISQAGTLTLPALLILDGGAFRSAIANPTGAYTYTATTWQKIIAQNAPAITGLHLNNNTSLLEVEVHGCPNLANLTLDGNTLMPWVDLDQQTEFNTLIITNNTLLTYLDLSQLDHTDNDLTISTNVALNSVLFNSLRYVTGNVFLEDNSALVTASFPVLETFSGDWLMTGCSALTTFSAPLMTGSSSGGVGLSFNLSGNTVLTNVTIPAIWPFVDSFTVDLSGCALTQAKVDAILASAVASSPAITTSTINLSGGTNATPSATGLADKATLNGAGNTVTTN